METPATLKILNSKPAKAEGKRLGMLELLKQICVIFMKKKAENMKCHCPTWIHRGQFCQTSTEKSHQSADIWGHSVFWLILIICPTETAMHGQFIKWAD